MKKKNLWHAYFYGPKKSQGGFAILFVQICLLGRTLPYTKPPTSKLEVPTPLQNRAAIDQFEYSSYSIANQLLLLDFASGLTIIWNCLLWSETKIMYIYAL